MVKAALFVRLEAKAGKEAEVESFFKSGLAPGEQEPATPAWFGIRLGPSTTVLLSLRAVSTGNRIRV